MIGQTFAERYLIEEKLGSGSFGTVWRAKDTRLSRPVALKVLHPVLNVDPETLRLFDREAQILAGLEHPNIVLVHDVGVFDNLRYIVMRHVAGRSLDQIVTEHGPQPPDRVLGWLADIVAGLTYAHQKQVIHRDLKPANLLLDEGIGRVVISDFGLARAVQMSGGSSSGGSLTGRGSVGTPAYMPPEVLQGGQFTPAGDLYSLGCVTYELLTGTPPYVGENEWAVGMQHLRAPIPVLKLPAANAGLAKFVTDLLAKTPDARPLSISDALVAAHPAPTIPAKVHTPPPAQSPVPSHQSPISFDWVTIPAGAFSMGSTAEQVQAVIAEASKGSYNGTFKESWITCEQPQHKVYVAEFRIARVPVTVAQFRAFVEATGYVTTAEEKGSAWSYVDKKWDWVKGADWRHPRGPESNVEAKTHHPVTCVSWHDAVAFCKWANVRLPTEAEWEKAARGTDGRLWPWGNEQPDKTRCNFNWTANDTTPVGDYPKGAGPYGVLDMAGNVREWTSTRWGGTDWDKPNFAYPYNADDGREDQNVEDSRVLRGGAFSTGQHFVRCAFRLRSTSGYRGSNFGFRVVGVGVGPRPSDL